MHQRNQMANPALVPGPYWHTKGLEFTSWQGVLRKEGSVRAVGGPKPHQPQPPKDELITLYMSTPTDVSGFVEQRSILALSPTFAEFFNSPSFVPGSATCIWLGREHPLVVKIALYYLLLHNPSPRSSSATATNDEGSDATPLPSPVVDYDDGDFHTPSLECHNPDDHVYLQIRLYFLAKRLQLPRLEDIAYQMLRAGERKIGANEVVDLAEVVYDKEDEEDPRIRLFLNRCVEMNLRALLHLPAWRAMLCEARPALAANMFELLSTLLLSGSAATYPPTLPPLTTPHSNTSTNPFPNSFLPLNKNVIAIAMRHFRSDAPGDLNISRGDVLRNCWIGAQWVVGSDARGGGGYFPRDWVELVGEAGVRETDETDAAEARGGGGIGWKAGNVLGLVPSSELSLSGARRRGKLAALQRKWKRVSGSA